MRRDPALHRVARHFGPAAALRVARDDVVPFRRLEADPALDAHLQHRDHADPTIDAIQDALSRHPGHAEPVTALAAGVTLKQYQPQWRGAARVGGAGGTVIAPIASA